MGVQWINNKFTIPQQCYGWFCAQRANNTSSKLQTLAVLWMALGPDKIFMTTKLPDPGSSKDGLGPPAKLTTELLDLSSFKDGFGPYDLSVSKTADLGSSSDRLAHQVVERSSLLIGEL